MPRLIIAFASLIVTACGGASVPPPVAVGSPAPAYVAATLAGDSVTLQQLRGRPVLLNVWATWCDPCREEMPALEQLHRRFASNGLTVLGASIDLRAGDADVRRFIQELDVTFPILRDPENRVSRIFQLIGVPGTVLIDRNGVIAHRWVGAFGPTGEESIRIIQGTLDRAAMGPSH